jgi:hypothetical protein
MGNSPNNLFRTSDTALAAYIQTEGYPVNDTDASGQRTVFTLNIGENDPKLLEMNRLFYAGKAKVEPSNYLRSYKILTRQARDGGV